MQCPLKAQPIAHFIGSKLQSQETLSETCALEHLAGGVLCWLISMAASHEDKAQLARVKKSARQQLNYRAVNGAAGDILQQGAVARAQAELSSISSIEGVRDFLSVYNLNVRSCQLSVSLHQEKFIEEEGVISFNKMTAQAIAEMRGHKGKHFETRTEWLAFCE